jgi:uncharacterized protein YcbK (DUF882 family)
MRARLLLTLAALFFVAACAGSSGGSRDLATSTAPGGDQRIVMWHKPSGERIDVTFRRGGVYDPEAFAQIDRIFRDRHNGDTYTIDPQLIEIIAGLRDRMVMPQDTPIELLSGYRSPETNSNLSRTNKYVAKQSYHMKGQAADIRIPDMNSRALELVAKTVQKGGVALYPDSRHVHVDTGPVRGWEVIKGQEAGMARKEAKARAETQKASLIPMVDKLPPVTVTKAPVPSAKSESNTGIKLPATKTRPTSLKGPAKKATPVYSSKKAPAKKPAAKKAAPKKAPAKKTPAKKTPVSDTTG